MSGLTLLLARRPEAPSPRLSRVLEQLRADGSPEELTLDRPLPDLRRRRLLFVVELGADGCSEEAYRLLCWLRRHPDGLEGCLGGILVDGESDLYTKAAARDLVLAANRSGCAFLGRPLVEATASLSNLRVQAELNHCSLEEAYRLAARELAERLRSYAPAPLGRPPRLLVLHVSNRSTSNTLAVWGEVRRQLPGCEVTEINLRNGTVEDCAGCAYQTCLHFGERGSCFYGGTIAAEVYPALERADAVVMLCPNYNDAIPANLSACINRLTAIFRTRRFYDKALYAVVVSGYSGGDLPAAQLVAAMNMNKSFFLPPRFALLETANLPGEALTLPGLGERAAAFARGMRAYLERTDLNF